MFAIVGSGFGLYGYLPAVRHAFGARVLLPEAYRARFEARPELASCAPHIRWTRDLEEALGKARTVIVATNPARQVEIADRCAALANVESVVLEKPLAPDPAAATALLERLHAAGKRCRAGYTLLHTRFAQGLAWPRAGAVAEVPITWTFTAHHFAQGIDNWKREHAAGGGPLRFFGIHLVALLASRGYGAVRESWLEGGTAAAPERWKAVFSGPGRPDCRIELDTRNPAARFAIALPASPVELADPYGSEEPDGDDDRRVGALARFLSTLGEPDPAHAAFADAVNTLWAVAEAATRWR
jgi:hypothetical protein